MDTIADMLTIIRNGLLIKKDKVEIPFSKEKFSIAKILQKQGYVNEVTEKGDAIFKKIAINLKYGELGGPVIKIIKRASKPGKRVYSPYNKLPKSIGGLGIFIISTSNGLMTAREAFKRKLGGEVICEVN